MTARVENVSRLRTSVLLAEDVTPDTLGSRPRFVLDEIEPGGHQGAQLPDPARKPGASSPSGPLRIRVADTFGLVETTKSFDATSTLVVTPKIVSLPRAAAPSSWLGEGDGGMRTISAIGEDDAAPRTYQDGDSLHRVHWKSTARYGELMVRREEHQWRNSASVFLDTRRCAHSGRGPDVDFRVRGQRGRLDRRAPDRRGLPGPAASPRPARSPPAAPSPTRLLDMLAVITPSREAGLEPASPRWPARATS